MTMLGYFRRLRQYQDLLTTFTLKDIQVRYKQTFLGAAWAITQPLAFMVILTALKSVIFGESGSEGAPYQIFFYCAMVPWVFFQNGLSFSVVSIAGNMNLVKKIYFPREIFPVSAILASVVDFLISSAIFIVMMLYFRIPCTWSLLWVPVLFGLEVVFVMALGMFVSASNVFYRDVKYIVPLVVQLLFFVSPVMYSVDRVPEAYRAWYLLNPMAVIIDGFRRAVIHGTGPDPVYLALSGLVSVLCWLLAYRYFKHCEARFADLI